MADKSYNLSGTLDLVQKQQQLQALQPQPTADNSGLLDTAGDFARGAAQGATLGFADELTGAGEATWDKLKALAMSQPSSPWAELYRKHQKESQAAYEASKQRSPIAYGAGQLAGNVGLGATTGALGLGLAGEGLGGAAATGAAYGGL